MTSEPPMPCRARPRCVLVTVAWGDWHVGAFLNANLPTMLAAGNLPAFAASVECDYLVYTTPKDAERMFQNPAFQRLRSLVRVQINMFRPSTTRNAIGLHHEIWNKATEHARNCGAFILLMPPDVVWADGSFARLGAVLEAGKRAIFMTYPRVVSETLVPAMLERFPPSPDNDVAVPPADMMALALTHIHPLMAAYLRSSSQFPIHPEMVSLPIEGDGFLLRLLARELFCFEPDHYALNSQALLAELPSAADVHVFCDSLEFLGFSLTPLWKDMEWYLEPGRLDPLRVGRWWIDYDSPFNDYLSSVDLRFRCGAAGEAEWRRAALQADALLTHLKSAREFTRVLMCLDQLGCSNAARFLASALRTQGLARRWPYRGPFLILAPRDDALRKLSFPFPGEGLDRAAVRRVLAAHLALLPDAGELRDGMETTTLAGRTIRLKDTALAERVGRHVLLPINEVLSAQGETGVPRERDLVS